MQTTPATYNPYADERISTVKVTYELIDTDAAESASPASSGECSISKLEQSHNKVLGMTKENLQRWKKTIAIWTGLLYFQTKLIMEK